MQIKFGVEQLPQVAESLKQNCAYLLCFLVFSEARNATAQ